MATKAAARPARTAQGVERLTPAPAREFRLWPGRAPDTRRTLPTYPPSMNGRPELRELWLRGMADPVVGVFRPARPNGTAVLSIPGGGYGFISIENEGIDLAKALDPAGITVFALAYRLPGKGWDNQQDVRCRIHGAPCA